MENPWLHLPTEPPYVLDGDREYVETFNNGLNDSRHKHYLQLNELLPEPFVGAKDAPILLLSNKIPVLVGKVQRIGVGTRFSCGDAGNNLHHAVSDWPLVYLNPAYSWETWWRRKEIAAAR